MSGHAHEGAGSHGDPAGLIERDAGVGEGRDHQAVPVRQNLVIEARAHPARTHRQELGPHRGKPFLILHAAR